MRILMINDLIPYPVISGAPLRTYNLLKRISGEHEVWFAAFVRTPEQANSILHLKEFCRGVETANMPKGGSIKRPIKAISYLAAGIPPHNRHYHSDKLEKRIHDLTSKIDFDVVQIEHATMGLYLNTLPSELHSKTLWMLHDIDWIKFKRISQLKQNPSRKFRVWLNSRILRHWKPRFAERFKRCITVSESDRHQLMAANSRLHVDVVPNGVDTNLCRPLPCIQKKPALIFVGNMGYQPNIDGIIHFCRESYPYIRSKLPDVELWITGINPSFEVRQLAGNNVHVTGFVDDVRPFYERSTVCVVPLRAGGGTRLKILEAMALGRPVVSTSVGCEGLDIVDGEHLFIANTSKQFAEKTVRLLTNEKLRQRITKQARELVVNRYDWDVLAKHLMQIYEEVAQ